MMTRRLTPIFALLFLLPCAACSWDQQKPETTLVPSTRTIALLPPAELAQRCAALPAADFSTTGDLVSDDQNVRELYEACAGKVAGVAQWRKAHAK